MWDCVPWVGDVEIGELTGIAIRTPLLHGHGGLGAAVRLPGIGTSMIANGSRAPMAVGAVVRRDARSRRRTDSDPLRGHFAGGTVLHAGDALLAGDIVQVIPDRGWVGFMYSYPNLIPLPEAGVRDRREAGAVRVRHDLRRVVGPIVRRDAADRAAVGRALHGAALRGDLA